MHLFHELVTYLLGIVEKLGYFGIILGLAMEVIPSETSSAIRAAAPPSARSTRTTRSRTGPRA
ncbi:hypothetical protein [Paenibacillus sp. P22]|uniref:hypothetical protein n=1 Tax=Paenibacillus sp. P22 TaxID=483908 RepID=UPI0012ED710A|nr:hypothetical protein [Paenibacillus sp. P22]